MAVGGWEGVEEREGGYVLVSRVLEMGTNEEDRYLHSGEG